MKKLTSLVLLLSLTALVACGGKGSSSSTTPAAGTTAAEQTDTPAAASDALPVIPGSPAAKPTAVLSEITIGNPNAQLGRIGAFADVVSPGMGAFVSPQSLMQAIGGMIGVPGIGGIDLNKPLIAVILDQKTAAGAILLVAAVQDEKVLGDSLGGGDNLMIVHNGFAAIGKRDALQAAAAYSLSNLAQSEIAEEPQIILHMTDILATSGQEFEAALRAELSGPVANSAGDAVLDFLGQIQTLRGSVVADQTGAVLRLDATPVAQSSLAQFTAAQKPADYSMLERLGMGPWGMVVAGRVDFTLLSKAFASMGQIAAHPLIMQIASYVGGLSSEMALAMNLPEQPEMAMTMGVPDAKGMAELIGKAFSAIAASKDAKMERMDIKVKMDAIKTRGGSLHELAFTPSKDLSADDKKNIAKLYGSPGPKAYVGVAVDRLVATFGTSQSARKYAQSLSADGKGKGKSKSLTAALEGSKSRQESLLVALDILSLQGTRKPKDGPLAILGVSFSPQNISLRLEVSAELVKEGAGG